MTTTTDADVGADARANANVVAIDRGGLRRALDRASMARGRGGGAEGGGGGRE